MLLWFGQFVSQLGDRLAMVAFPWLIYRNTTSAFSTGVVLALYTLPYVLFGTVAGVFVDRFNKRSVMVLADLARAAIVLMVPLAAQQSITAVYVLSFLVSSVAVLFEPSKLSLIPELVPKRGLVRANSVLATGETLAEVVGYGLAGLTLAYVSAATAFRLDAATFAVSAVALLLMRYSPSERVFSRNRSVVAEAREGLAFLRQHRGLLANTLLVMAFMAGLGASYPLTFFFAVRVLDSGARGFALLEAAIGLGFFVGSIVLVTFATRVRKGPAMLLGLAMMGVTLMLLAATQEMWQSLSLLAAFGVANAAALIAIDAYVQDVVPEPLRGRVWGVRFTITQGVYAASVLAAAGLAEIVNLRVLVLVAGGIMLLPGVLGFLVRDVRDA